MRDIYIDIDVVGVCVDILYGDNSRVGWAVGCLGGPLSLVGQILLVLTRSRVNPVFHHFSLRCFSILLSHLEFCT